MVDGPIRNKGPVGAWPPSLTSCWCAACSSVVQSSQLSLPVTISSAVCGGIILHFHDGDTGGDEAPSPLPRKPEQEAALGEV